MVQLEIKTASLVSWARGSRHSLADREYLIHSAMRLTFGSKAPQPFEVFDTGSRLLKVLGYSEATAEELLETMSQTAEPALMDTFPRMGIRSKAMPLRWDRGSEFGFRLRCCPVSRRSDEANNVIERDIFLAVCEKEPEKKINRETVYSEWLQTQSIKQGGGELCDVRMKAFRLKEFNRRDKNRKLHRVTRPDVLFEGILKVVDSQKFSALLREGIGRHKAFGFGAIFLRPIR